MAENNTCPKCSSANTMFSKKRGAFLCEDCGHQFVREEKFVPKRVFISYGHDEHAELAIRLSEDLKRRGHQVWFDAEQLHAGSGWEQRIEQGLKNLVEDPANSAVILLLTPYSVRRPNGYCLNEVAYAQAKGLSIIPVMVVETEPPLSIYTVQWLDMRECVPLSAKESVYLNRYERLLKALELRELDFEGAQSRLLNTLCPIYFSADIAKLLKDFTGRKWVFDEVDAWFSNPSGSKIFWITGAPGVGKSVISAWIRDHRREVAAFHFCDINSEEKRNAGKLVRSIAYQLSTQLPEYQERLANLPLESIVQEYHEAYTLFDKLIIQPLADHFPPPDRTVVVLIDALDEATYQRQNEIVRFLSMCVDKTPSWLRFLVTSRPEPEILSAFQSLSPYVLDTGRPENLDDLREYLGSRIHGITPAQVEVILGKSEGVFLYVRHVAQSILEGKLSLERPDEFPRGLGDVYQQFFRRQFGGDSSHYESNLRYYEQTIAPLLGPVLAAYEPLALGLLKAHCGIKEDTALLRLLQRLGSLFPASGQTDADTVRPFHRSVIDWITDRNSAGDFVIAITDGKRALANQGWVQFESGQNPMDNYYLAWLPAHLRELANVDCLSRLLADFPFLMSRVKSGFLENALEDYRSLSKDTINASRELQIYAAFFREKAHILRRGTQSWPAHKILLQLAVEHADDSPLSIGAEQWLALGKCDWVWLRRKQRPKQVEISACVAVLEGHSAVIRGVEILPDGRILSWGWDKTLRIWDAATGKCQAVLKGHSELVKGAEILPDGRILSWANHDKTLRIWDAATGKSHAVLEGHKGRIRGVRILTDGRILTWAIGDKTLRIWDAATGKCLAVLEGHSAMVRSAEILLDGRSLSWAIGDKTFRIWDAATGKSHAVLEGHTGGIDGVRILPDGRILSWASDKTFRIWDPTTGKCHAVLEGHTGDVDGVRILPDGLILSWASDKEFRIWDAVTGKSHAVLEGHSAIVRGAEILPGGRILSWASDKTLRIWDPATGKCHAVLEGHTGDVDGVRILPDGRILSWAEGDCTLRIWDPVTGKCGLVFEGHSSDVQGVFLLPDTRILSWAEGDCTLRIWDPETGKCIEMLEGHTSDVQGAFLLSGGHILSWGGLTAQIWDLRYIRKAPQDAIHSGTFGRIRDFISLGSDFYLSMENRTLRVWDRATETCIRVCASSGDIFRVLPAQLAEPRNLLPIRFCEKDQGVKEVFVLGTRLELWDIASGRLLVSYKWQDRYIGAKEIQFLPDGKMVSFGYDANLYTWDLATGECLAVLEGHTDPVDRVKILPAGRILSWAYRTLRIWDAVTGKCLAVLEGHRWNIRGVKLLPDGRILSFALDKMPRIWDAATGKCLAVLKGHRGGVDGVRILPDGRILSWASDATLRIWDAATGKCHAVLEGHDGCVKGVLPMPDGRILSWSENDLKLCLWDPDTGKCLALLEGHKDSVLGVLLLPDGRILSWSSDFSLRVWSNSGIPLAIHHLKEGDDLFPELRTVKSFVKAKKTALFPWDWVGEENACTLHKSGDAQSLLGVWHGASRCTPRFFYPDGKAILTQDNDEVCFLQLYYGNSPLPSRSSNRCKSMAMCNSER